MKVIKKQMVVCKGKVQGPEVSYLMRELGERDSKRFVSVPIHQGSVKPSSLCNHCKHENSGSECFMLSKQREI